MLCYRRQHAACGNQGGLRSISPFTDTDGRSPEGLLQPSQPSWSPGPLPTAGATGHCTSTLPSEGRPLVRQSRGPSWQRFPKRGSRPACGRDEIVLRTEAVSICSTYFPTSVATSPRTSGQSSLAMSTLGPSSKSGRIASAMCGRVTGSAIGAARQRSRRPMSFV